MGTHNMQQINQRAPNNQTVVTNGSAANSVSLVQSIYSKHLPGNQIQQHPGPMNQQNQSHYAKGAFHKRSATVHHQMIQNQFSDQ